MNNNKLILKWDMSWTFNYYVRVTYAFLYINFTDIWMCWCVFNTRYSSVSTDPVQTGLIHALRLLLELEVLAVHTQTLDVCRQVRHVGHPGHRTLGRGRGSIESGRRLWALKHTDTERTWERIRRLRSGTTCTLTLLSIMKDGGCVQKYCAARPFSTLVIIRNVSYYYDFWRLQ